MRQILLILSIILLITAQAPAQGNSNPAGSIIRSYPNPATSYVTFDFQKNYDKGYTLRVFSFLGKKMFEAANISDRTTINLTEHNFNRGIYIYQLYDRTGKLTESGKFQVSR